jgi:hypothetical protein
MVLDVLNESDGPVTVTVLVVTGWNPLPAESE